MIEHVVDDILPVRNGARGCDILDDEDTEMDSLPINGLQDGQLRSFRVKDRKVDPP